MDRVGGLGMKVMPRGKLRLVERNSTNIFWGKNNSKKGKEISKESSSRGLVVIEIA